MTLRAKQEFETIEANCVNDWMLENTFSARSKEKKVYER